MIHDAFEMISLLLTSPLVFFSIWVVLLFRHEARKALTRKPKKPTEWFAMGVTIGFLGSIFDNLYWGFAWSANFLGNEFSETLFEWGVLSNVPFRQIAGMLAAYCHVRCAIAYSNDDGEKKRIKVVLLTSLLAGVAYVLLLLWWR